MPSLSRQYADRVRAAFGAALLHDGLMLKIVQHGIKMCIEGDQVNALDERERRVLRSAIEDIRSARIKVRAVSKECV